MNGSYRCTKISSLSKSKFSPGYFKTSKERHTFFGLYIARHGTPDLKREAAEECNTFIVHYPGYGLSVCT